MLAATPKPVTLDVQHTTCELCPVTVRKSLENVPGVSAAKVDFKHKTATMTYDRGLRTPRRTPAIPRRSASEATVNVVAHEFVLTCPYCGFAKVEAMPADACQWLYECKNCRILLKPKASD